MTLSETPRPPVARHRPAGSPHRSRSAPGRAPRRHPAVASARNAHNPFPGTTPARRNLSESTASQRLSPHQVLAPQSHTGAARRGTEIRKLSNSTHKLPPDRRTVWRQGDVRWLATCSRQPHDLDETQLRIRSTNQRARGALRVDSEAFLNPIPVPARLLPRCNGCDQSQRLASRESTTTGEGPQALVAAKGLLDRSAQPQGGDPIRGVPRPPRSGHRGRQ